MNTVEEIKANLFDPSADFMRWARKAYHFQRSSVAVFKTFTDHLGRTDDDITDSKDFPFLPIEFFRSETILPKGSVSELYFESSGTTHESNSRHYLADTAIYQTSIIKGFEHFYGPVDDYVFFALLPSYLEREHASLVYMTRHLMETSGDPANGFYKFNYDALINDLDNYTGSRKKVLIGVTFALWDLAEHPSCPNLSDVLVLETGGMKGRRHEIVREQLHQMLHTAFKTSSIHSEYGMTELLSQAYSNGDGIFECPPWMQVLIRDPYDPLHVASSGKGALNIIDLANLNSCSFIATNDIGEVFEDGTFKVNGRLDNSRLRGCNLMFA